MILNKILRGLITSGLFLIFLTPFIVSSSLFFPFITGKAFFFRIVTEIIFVLWIVLALRDPSARPRRSSLLCALGIFGVIVTLATIFSQYPYHSFWSNFERMEGLVTYLHLGVYWLVLVSVFKTEKWWRRFFNASLVASFIIAVYGLFQLAGLAEIHQGGIRLDATFGNSIYLAVYMLINFFLAVYFLLDRRTSRWLRYVYGPLALLQFFILYYTATRGAMVGLIIGLVTAGTLILWRGRDAVPRRVKKIVIGVFVVLVILAGSLYSVRQTDFVQQSPVLSRFANISLQDSSTKARLLIWQMSLQGAKEHLLLGWGPDNYNLVFNKYYNPQLWNQEQWFDRSHNIFLDWLISAGLLGLAGYLSLFAVALYLIWRRPRAEQNHSFTVVEQSLFTGLLVGYFCQNIFVFDNLMSYILFLIILGFIHFATTRAPAPTSRGTSLPSALPFAVGFVALIGLAGAIYWLNVKPMMAAGDLITALSPAPPPTVRLDYFKQTFALNTFGSSEASEQAVSVASVWASDKTITDTDRQAMATLALENINKQIAASPTNARSYYFLGLLSQSFNQTDLALTAFAKAQEFSPKKQSIIDAPISILIGQKKYPEALAAAKQAYELEPTAIEPLKIYALVAIYAGEQKTADQLIQTLSQLDPNAPLDDRFVNAFAGTKQYDKLLKLWQTKVVQDETNVDDHFHLAAVYFVTGDHASAIKEIQTAIKLDPTKQAEGEKLISDIRAGRNPLQ